MTTPLPRSDALSFRARMITTTVVVTVLSIVAWQLTTTDDDGPDPVDPAMGATNLMMVTNSGGFGSGNDSAKKTLFEGWGWTVTGFAAGSSAGAYATAAAANDVLFFSDTAGGGSAIVADLDIGVVTEILGGWRNTLYSASDASAWANNTNLTLVDNSHYITTPFSTGSLAIHASSDDVNYWDSGSTALPAGVTVLAESLTSTNHDTLLVADTGATLYSANTAPNRRVWFPSDAAAPSVFTSDYETLLERSLDWAAANEPPATVTVNSTADTGDNGIGDDVCDTGGTNSEGATECTLRAAIEEANGSSVVNTIEFAIPTSDSGYSASPLAFTLTPASGYDPITSTVSIDGTTQPEWVDDPIIELDGTSAAGATAGLALRADDSTISGFIVHSFPDEGLEIDGSTGAGDNNVLTNNWVGLNAAGSVVGNTDHGILVTVDALNNLIGGTGANAGNRVAGSGGDGINVRTNSFDNTVIGNTTWANTQRGIDLDDNGVTANDVGDGDTGSNDLLNFPVIAGAWESGGTVTVTFDLDVPANPDQYRVEFFSNPSGADPAGYGEGQVLVSSTTADTGPGSTHTFAGSIGDVITATVTKIDSGASTGFGPTSEFSAAATVSASDLTTVVFQDGATGYSGTIDTWISSSLPNQDNSAGLAIELDNSPSQDGLIRFDGIVGANPGQVPTGATVVAAELVVEGGDPSDAGATVSLYRMLQSWVETDTWNSLGSGVSTDDVEASSTPDTTHSGGLDVTDTPIVIDGLGPAVQAWVGGSANRGWLLTLDNANGWDIRSSDSTSADQHPRLEVTFATGPIAIAVNSTGDGGDATPGDALCDTGGTNAEGHAECTLRAAIEEANASSIIDTIRFAIPTADGNHSSGVWTITPTAASLPLLATAVSLDATTQAGYGGTPVVVLDGAARSAGEDGLGAGADGATISGLSIVNFPDDGVFTSNDGVTFDNLWLGVLPSGTTAANGSSDLVVFGAAAGTTVDSVVFASAGADDGAIVDSTTTGTVIQDSFFGVTPTFADLSPVGEGLIVSGTATVTVTGTVFGHLPNAAIVPASGTLTVTGSSFGTDLTGTQNLPIAQALWGGGTAGVTFGGTGGGDGNIVRNTTSDAIELSAGMTGEVSVLGNSIAGSAGLGIDLAPDGVNENDGGDSDGGPNDLLNFPVLSSVSEAGGIVTADYALDAPAGVYRVEFFTNPSGADVSGNGEGENFVHGTSITHTGSGSESFSTTFSGSTGDVVTTTATEDQGGGSYGPTSEFSDAFTAVAGTLDPVVLDHVQSGTVVLADGASSVTATISAVDTTKTFLTYGLRGSDTDPQDLQVGGELTDSTTLTFTRIGTGGDMTIDWSVAEFSSGVSVQRGVTPQASTTVDVAIGAVDLTRSFPLVGYQVDGFTFGDNDWVRASLTSATNLRLQTVGAGGSVVPWQVVSYNDAVVQSGSVALGSGDSSQTASITAVDPAKAWLTYSMASGSGTSTDIGQKLIRGQVTNATTLTFDRSSTGVAVDVDWHVVEFTDSAEVQHANATFGTSTAAVDVAITAVDRSRAFGTGGYLGYGGRTDHTTDDNAGHGWFTTELTAADTLRVERGATGSNADVGWSVIEWVCADSDADGITDCHEDANTDGDNDPSTTPGPDTDGDTTANYLDADDDGDGTNTSAENADPNGDGDPRDAHDVDHDGQPDYLDSEAGRSSTPVLDQQKISQLAGGLTGPWDGGDWYGTDATAIGDLDGDGVVDVAIGANGDDDGGSNKGAVEVLFLTADGTVKAEQKISDTTGGLAAPLDTTDWFGASVANIGDIDGDGIPDLAVGAALDDDGGTDRGAAYILFLNADGTVKAEQKISDTTGGFTGTFTDSDQFGFSLAGLGDLDGDGIGDLAVGSSDADDAGTDRGAIHIVFLNPDGTVKTHQRISDTTGGLTSSLPDGGNFGTGLANLGDVDGDGVTDIAVGAWNDDDGGSARGAVYVLMLNADGTVKAEQKISATVGGFGGTIDGGDDFGAGVAGVGDLDGDGIPDLVAGAPRDDDGGSDRGALWVLTLNANGTVATTNKISSTDGGLTGPLDDGDQFGYSVAGLGDLDGDGGLDLLAGAWSDDDGATDTGAVYVLGLTGPNALVVANDDSATVIQDRTTGIDVLANDVDADGDALTILEATDGPNGTTSISGGQVWYTPTASYTGADSFTYVAADAGTDVTNYWSFDGAAADGVGGDDGVLSGTSTVTGDTGDALAFNETSDRVTFPDITYGTSFTLSIDFKLDDNTGSLFQYLYSHGNINSTNSINIFFVEGSHGTNPDVLRTVMRDGDDSLDNAALQFDISSIVGDGQWHTYTVNADSNSGLTVWLDGAVQATDPTRGTGTTDPTGSLYLGARDDLAAGRWYGGSVDTMQLIDGSPATTEMADREAQVNHATVNVTVAACADADADGLCDPDEDANTDADDNPATTPGPDTDGDTTANYLDADDDGDGTPTSAENADPNGDGDPRDALDADHDGEPDFLDLPTGTAGPIVVTEQKITEGRSGLTATLDDSDSFGYATASIGDLDGDGIVDVATGALFDDDGGTDRGAVHVLFLNADGTVKAEQKISETTGGLVATLDDDDGFGSTVAALGDVDGDGIGDLAIGARGDDDGGTDRGAVYVLFLNVDGTVKAEQKIAHGVGGLTTNLVDNGWFGGYGGGIGDLDGDGTPDLAVAAHRNDELHILFLNPNGTVKAEQEIATGTGGLTATVTTDDFGSSVAAIGDLDGDGFGDLVVGAFGDDDGGSNSGAVHVLFLNANGTVKAEQKITEGLGGGPTLDVNDFFGASTAALGDLYNDGSTVVAVGATGDDDGGTARGALYLLSLDNSGTAVSVNKISETSGDLVGAGKDFAEFGASVASLGDLDGDGTIGLAVGAYGDDGGVGSYEGAVYILDLGLDPAVTAGLLNDASVRRSDLAPSGGIDPAVTVSGMVADALSYNAGTDRLVGPATDLTSGAWTLSGWMNATSFGTDPRLAAKTTTDGDTVYELLIDDSSGSTGQATARLKLGATTHTVTGGSISTGTWHHLAATWNGTTLTLYVDGALVDSTAAAGAIATDPTLPFTVGNLAAADRGFDGIIDEVRLTHRAATADQVGFEHSNLTNPGTAVTIGAEQTAAVSPWTIATSQARSGTNAAAAPEINSPGADAWLTATGLDEPGLSFTTWWWLSTATGIDLAAGTRTGAVPTDQYETAVTSTSGWDLATDINGTRTQQATPAGAVSINQWVEVEIRTDENGNSTVIVDDTQLIAPTAQGTGLLTGSAGLRAGLLPTGQDWYVDDARARKLIGIEPTTSVGPLERQ